MTPYIERCIPQGPVPQFFWLQEIYKRDIPLKPIVSSMVTATYGVAEELARVLRPLTGKSPHHIKIQWTL